MDRGSAMGRERDLECVTERGHAQEAGDAAATRGIRLKRVDRASFEHLPEIIGCVTVFASCDLHRGGRMIAKQAQAFEVVAGDRFLKPADPQF